MDMVIDSLSDANVFKTLQGDNDNWIISIAPQNRNKKLFI